MMSRLLEQANHYPSVPVPKRTSTQAYHFKSISWSRLSHFLKTSSRYLHEEASCIDYSVVPLNHPIDVDRTVGRMPEEQYRRYLMSPNQPENPKSLRVSIIGEPNGGKSTLVNRLMGWRVNAVSSKVHTTRKNTSGIITEGDTQIVFVDTPGVITPQQRKKHSCDVNMVTDPEESLHEVDAVGVVVDLSDQWTRTSLNKEVLKILHLHPHVKSFLVLNKVDAIKKKRVLLVHDIIQRLTYGMIGGDKVAALEKRTPIDKNKKIKMNDAYFDKLESKYGEFKRESKSSSSSFLHSFKQTLTHDETIASHEEDKNEKGQFGMDQNDNTNIDSATDKLDSEVDDNNLVDNAGETGENKELLAIEKSYQSDYLERLRAIANPNLSSTKADSNKKKEKDSDSWMKKMEALQKADQNKGYGKFDRVFIVSALEGDGIEVIKDYLLDSAKPGPWEYHSCLVTPQHPYEIAKMCVWQAVLDNVPNRPAYQCNLSITYWNVDENDCLDVVMEIIVDYQMQRYLGDQGEIIKKISHTARQALLDAFRCEVSLKLKVDQKSRRSRSSRR